jgi:hypothetical protein
LVKNITCLPTAWLRLACFPTGIRWVWPVACPLIILPFDYLQLTHQTMPGKKLIISEGRRQELQHFITKRNRPGWKEGKIYYFHWTSVQYGISVRFKAPAREPEGNADFGKQAEDDCADDDGRMINLGDQRDEVDFLRLMERDELEGFKALDASECVELERTPSGVSGRTLSAILSGEETDTKTILAAEGQLFRVYASMLRDENDTGPLVVWMMVVRRLLPGSVLEKLVSLYSKLVPSVQACRKDEHFCRITKLPDEYEGYRRRLERRYARVELLEEIEVVAHMIRRDYMDGKCFSVHINRSEWKDGLLMKGVWEEMQSCSYVLRDGKRKRQRLEDDMNYAVCSSECSCNESDSDSAGEAEPNGRKRRKQSTGSKIRRRRMILRPQQPPGAYSEL